MDRFVFVKTKKQLPSVSLPESNSNESETGNEPTLPVPIIRNDGDEGTKSTRTATSSGCIKNNNASKNDEAKSSGNSSTSTKTTTSTDGCIENKNKSDVPRKSSDWIKMYPWLAISKCEADKLIKKGSVICSICSEAVNRNLPLPTSSRSIQTKDAFVTNGFSTWSRASAAFKNHEKSEFHLASVRGLSNMKKTPVVQHLSDAKKREMNEARVALDKIFETVLFTATEGLPFRGSYNADTGMENSKLMRILELRANDIPQLRSWLDKSSRSKWIHHDIIEEILKMLCNNVLKQILAEVKNERYYTIMLDETSDIRRLEQVSIVLRYVTDDLIIKEEFLGFYETSDGKAETLFRIVKDVLMRFELDLSNCRGQCYDGASSVSGDISGLKTRILEVCPYALYVHCVAHRLNLVVQDALTDITDIKNFIGTIKELINFIKKSPRRLAVFKNLQGENVPNLVSYCSTRWCVRIKSLQTIKQNYQVLIEFLDELIHDKGSDATITATAQGFQNKLETFSFYFNVEMLILIFERVETLNAALQKVDLNLNESHANVKVVLESIRKCRENDFDNLWSNAKSKAEILELEPPILPRIRKAPRRYDSQSSAHEFASEKEYYRKSFFEIIDLTLVSLNDRFQSDTMDFLSQIENFVINENDGCVKKISSFYNKDGFDEERLILHRNMLLDIMVDKNGVKPHNITEVVSFVRSNLHLRNIIPQVVKLLKIILTVPVSNATCERSFSSLRRLKTYLRSSLKAERLNHIAVLHVHNNNFPIDLTPIINEFILKKS